MTEDHPLDYLLFEGLIPRTKLWRWFSNSMDTGTYITEDSEQNISEQFKKGRIIFTLFGEKLKGKFSLIKTARENQWL